MKLFGRGLAGLGLVMVALLFAGCATDKPHYPYDPLAQTAPPANSGGMPASNGATAVSNTPLIPPGPVDATQTMLHKGDDVSFAFSDTPSPLPAIGDTVKEDGTVTLMYNERFQADGKTIGTLQQEIHDRYVPKYFKYLTVNIKPSERFYYVGGEVRGPNRFVYSGKMTVLQAIDTAGGFTDFSRKGKVQVTRANGEIFYVDCRAALTNPELNREIFPNDKIQVFKRIW